MVAQQAAAADAGAVLGGSTACAASGGHSQQHQLSRMQACVHHLLTCIQEDPTRQGLLDTPKVSWWQW